MQLNAFPGQSRVLSLIGLDEFDNPTYFVGRITDKDGSLFKSFGQTFDLSSSFEPPENYSMVYEKKVSFYNCLSVFGHKRIACCQVLLIL